MANTVLDSSAILALFQAEAGADRVAALLLDANQSTIISTLNWSEVVDRLLRNGIPATDAERRIARLGMEVVEFDLEQARIAATLRILAPPLSLADRACLALASVRSATAWTADKIWAQQKVGVKVEILR